MRTYEKTHPWITFRLDLNQASHKVWLLLGEAQSKTQHIAGVPLLPSVSKHLQQVYLAKGVRATTAIEGNTLSDEEVLQRVRGELELPLSKEYLGQEIDNIVDAYNFILNRIMSGESSDLNVGSIKDFNRLVLRKLPLGEDVSPGEIRQYSVGVGSYRGAPAEDCEFLLDRLARWLNSGFEPLPGYSIAFGILKAIIAHLYIAWIHPFADGNGRTARLIELQILLSTGVPAAAAHLLSNFYNQTRTEYYRQLDRASQTGGDVFPFIEYALQGLVDGLREQLDVVQAQQLRVHWINYIYDQFRDKDGVTAIRQRRLMLDLTDFENPIPISEIRYISPRIAEAYAERTDKTVRRDVRDLEELGLVRRTSEGVIANREQILAFLSPVRPDENQSA